MVEITLAEGEAKMAAAVGEARHLSALAEGRAHAYGCVGRSLGMDVQSAGGELAAAIVLNLPWTGCYFREPGHPKRPDIGERTDVKTAARHHHRLMVHRNDRDDWFFVLVTGELPTYRVVGWLRGRDAKQAEFWADPTGTRPAFFAPQSALTPITAMVRRPHLKVVA